MLTNIKNFKIDFIFLDKMSYSLDCNLDLIKYFR